MKKLFIGLLATGFMTLSSFNIITANKKSKVDDAYGCCTAHNKSWSQSVRICGDYPNSDIRCANALAAYYAIY
jgi:hypothetical protein